GPCTALYPAMDIRMTVRRFVPPGHCSRDGSAATLENGIGIAGALDHEAACSQAPADTGWGQYRVYDPADQTRPEEKRLWPTLRCQERRLTHRQPLPAAIAIVPNPMAHSTPTSSSPTRPTRSSSPTWRARSCRPTTPSRSSLASGPTS